MNGLTAPELRLVRLLRQCDETRWQFLIPPSKRSAYSPSALHNAAAMIPPCAAPSAPQELATTGGGVGGGAGGGDAPETPVRVLRGNL